MESITVEGEQNLYHKQTTIRNSVKTSKTEPDQIANGKSNRKQKSFFSKIIAEPQKLFLHCLKQWLSKEVTKSFHGNLIGDRADTGAELHSWLILFVAVFRLFFSTLRLAIPPKI